MAFSTADGEAHLPAAPQLEVWKAAVVGSPIAHSQSPVLHRAAFRALGLRWTYDRIDCTAERFPDMVDALGPEWIGLSVTMPNKVAALDCATHCSARAQVVGSANTLVRTSTGWRADSTDVDGVSGALRAAGVSRVDSGVVVGAGGTARPALLALSELGARELVVVARNAERARPTVEVARHVGADTSLVGFDPAALRAVCARADAVVSTVPAAVAASVAGSIAAAPVVVDAIYDPWPTPLASEVRAAGHTAVSGVEMLLHQAFGQVEQFTGRPAPREAMTEALYALDMFAAE